MFEVGTRVYDERYGYGTVISNIQNPGIELCVEFDEKSSLLHNGCAFGHNGGKSRNCWWYNINKNNLQIVDEHALDFAKVEERLNVGL